MYQFFHSRGVFLPIFILVFSLLASTYIVFAQVQSAAISGICLVWSGKTAFPSISSPDVGPGYAKMSKSGVNDILKLRQVCTRADYENLLRQYCVDNSDKAQEQVATFSKQGGLQSNGGGPFGNDYRSCPVSESAKAKSSKGSGAIQYPVAELGSCKNESECRAFCDARDNLERAKACIAFAKKHNLLSLSELEEAERYVIGLGIAAGPGGCRGQKACEAYCEDTAHLGECLDFAQLHNLRPAQEIEEGRKLVAALQSGAQLPGGCKNKNSCMAYCEDASHMKECVDFAQKAGFISSEEAEEAQKIIPLLERGEKTPGNCGRKAACEAYCMEPSHLDECLAFAQKADLISPEELVEAKKFIPLIKRGETPGQCKSKTECENYCADTAHFEECVAFAEKAGMISKEDAEVARKIKGKGPGGCSSREACEEFCKNPENQETCMNFAKEHGLIEGVAEVEAKVRAEVEAKTKVCLEKSCGEFMECLKGLQSSGAGEEASKTGLSPEEIGKGLPADVQAKLQSCIEEIKAQQIKEATKGIIPHEGPQPTPGEASQLPPQQTPQSPEYQKQYEEESKKQYEQEYQKQFEEQTKSVDCAVFAVAPNCEFVGTLDSPAYKLCKQCFPNK